MAAEKILVVMGGTSSEREISIQSGNAMYEALNSQGYNVEKFVLNEDNAAEIIEKKPSLVVLGLHGKGGEDGMIQGFLELAGIPYTGSGLTSSAISMNKIISKKLFVYDGIRTAKFLSLSHQDDYDANELAERAIAELGLPIVVKAPCQGSSVGIEIVKSSEELPGAIDRIYPFDHEILFEEFLPGIELSIPVVDDGKTIKTLPIIEIISENEFYDFESKYTEGMCHHIIPARIPDSLAQEINELSIEAYRCLKCRGIARVDVMLGPDNKPYVVEINTLPGMTNTSLVPDAAKAAGITPGALLETMIESVKTRQIERR